MSAPGCFVTGTDTGVGKTRISAGLLWLLGQGGALSAGIKPVAAGIDCVDGRWVNRDVALLRAASTLALSDAEVGPCQLRHPYAPHLSAETHEGRLDRAALVRTSRDLAARCDWLVVEGMGGFQVPLGGDWDTADLAADLGLPVILVVGLRPGCLNHALLTAQAVRARGLKLAGWIGNTIDPNLPWQEDDIHMLRLWLSRRHGAPCLGAVPWLPDPAPVAVATFLETSAVRSAFRSGGWRAVEPSISS